MNYLITPDEAGDRIGRLSRRALLRRAAALGLSAPIVASLLAACGGDDESTTTTGGAATTTTGGGTTGGAATTTSGGGSTAAGASPAAATSGSPAASGTTERERRVALTADVGSFDPYKDNSVVGVQVQGQVFEPLVDFRGPQFTQTLLVAERFENPDPTTWRFYLRKGVKFHDGKDVTAEDVKFTIELAQQSPTAKAKVANITAVNVVDSSTVEIKTSGPAASLLANLGFIFILPKADYEARGAEAFGQKPIGSGPYKMDSWEKAQRVTLSAFDGYWGGKKQPERITVRPIAEAATRIAELTTGGVDIISDLPVPNVPQVKADRNLAVIQDKGIRQIFFPFNSLAEGPLKDKRVRQAINFALDRDTIVKDVLEDFGEARTGPFGPKQMGFNEEASKFYSYNPEKAKQLLSEAGFANGFDLKWMFAKGSFLKDQEILETVIQNLRAVGIRMSLDLMEVNQLFANQNEGNFQVGMIRWSRQYDTDTVLAGISVQGGTQKWYKNDEVDRLVVKGRETLDPKEREKVYQDLYKAMLDDPGYVYLHAQDQVWGKRASSNWTINVFSGNASLSLFY